MVATDEISASPLSDWIATHSTATSTTANALLASESDRKSFERPSFSQLCELLLWALPVILFVSLVIFITGWGFIEGTDLCKDRVCMGVALSRVLDAVGLVFFCPVLCLLIRILAWSVVVHFKLPRFVLTLDGSGVTICGSGLTISWEEFNSIERVISNRKSCVPFSQERVFELAAINIKPFDERCAARWKQSWRPLSSYIPCSLLPTRVDKTGVVILRIDAFNKGKQLDRSLCEFYSVFAGQLRVNDTGSGL